MTEDRKVIKNATFDAGVPKKWHPGVADQTWKVIVCAQDAYSTEQAIHKLIYVLTDAGGHRELGLDLIRAMSGAVIVDGLLDYIESSRKSVENALSGKEAGG